MKNYHAYIYTGIFITLMIFGISATAETLTGKSLKEIYNEAYPEPTTTANVDKTRCRRQDAIKDLEFAVDPHLQKLAEHQNVCNSFVTDELMVFIDMPNNNDIAKQRAKELATTLKEFKSYGVTPIVVVEPVSDWGLIDFEEFQGKLYNPWINTFFKTLKAQGITEDEMGMWVPFPEANLPYWNRQTSKPKEFGFVINEYNKLLLKHFPDAHISLLLNSASFESTDYEWSDGQYISFNNYLENITPGTISSFGIQGFPWKSSADKNPINIDDPKEFLAPELLIEAARELETNKIWINTGTFNNKYTLNPDTTVTSSADERDEILTGIAQVATELSSKGLEVKLNIFAEDKSTTQEATNWSYFNNGYKEQTEHTQAYKEFIKKIDNSEVQISLFDTTN